MIKVNFSLYLSEKELAVVRAIRRKKNRTMHYSFRGRFRWTNDKVVLMILSNWIYNKTPILKGGLP